MNSDPFSLDVRIHGVRKYQGKRGTTYTVRWRVAGKDFQRTFSTAKLADVHRAELLTATRSGIGFNRATGLPSDMQTRSEVSWLDHAIDFAHMKWPDASPKYRRSLADSLVLISLNMLRTDRLPAPESEVRAVLRSLFALHPSKPAEVEEGQLGDEIERWLRRNSRALSTLGDRTAVRDLLDRIANTKDGKRAAQSTIIRRRSALHNCLDFAVERGGLAVNPLNDMQRKRLPPAPAIDRRRVANPQQARSLLAAVTDIKPELAGFFALMYYAGPRPGEVLNLRSTDLELPATGWGRVLLSTSYQGIGGQWTDDGKAGEERQLKHRALGDTRTVPAHPELVEILRRHLAEFPTGSDDRLFVARTGRAGKPMPPPYNKPVSMNTIYRTWTKARQRALTRAQEASPLAQRPYDLRHACLSTWLNAGVPAVQVAEWAGHSVAVLLSVYAKCIDGQEAIAIARIEEALGTSTPPTRS